MTRRRFYAPPNSFADKSVALSPEESRHLREVLRLREGDEVFVFDGEGREFSCLVSDAGRGNSSARLDVREEVTPASPESPLALTLAVGLLKGEKFDLVVQKATELGVHEIVPVMTARSDVRLRDAGDGEKKVARWQRLALEACKQSGRARIPRIHSPVEFSELLKRHSASEEMRLMFSERDGNGLVAISGGLAQRPSVMTALVGPEGGWDDDEISLAAKSGWSVVTLGGRIVRAETAAITIVALLQHLFGDLR
jgi:16S rRNA (uracil1498-N3)-methyltransferase